MNIIIHPYDPTEVICYLIWGCDITVHITYLISHSSSLSCYTVIKGYFRLGVVINSKLPSFVDIINQTSLGFPSWCPEIIRPTDLCFQGTSWENLVIYCGLYQHTQLVLYIDQCMGTYFVHYHSNWSQEYQLMCTVLLFE